MNGKVKVLFVFFIILCNMVSGNFFDYATIYGAAKVKTPYLNGNENLIEEMNNHTVIKL
jgi:hypothetical protein